MNDEPPPPGNASAADEARTLRRRAEAIADQNSKSSLAELDAMSADETRDLLHESQVHQIELELQNEELHRAQEELEESRSRYFDLYHLAPVGYFTVNAQGIIHNANLTAANMIGIPRSMLIRQPVSRFIHKDDQDTYYLHRRLLMENHVPQASELRVVRPDGRHLWVYLQCSIQTTSFGEDQIHCVLSDISERKLAEKTLKENEAFQRDILNSLPAHIAVLDNQGMIIAVNGPWLKFAEANGNPLMDKIGVGADYLETCNSASLGGDSYAEKALAGLRAVLSGRQSRFTLEYPCDSPDEKRWFAMEVLRSAGNSSGAIVSHRDVTERVQAAEKLRLANQQLMLHFEHTPMGAIEWDIDFRITRWNPAAEAIFGYSREEAIGRHGSLIIPGAIADQVDEIWQALLKKHGGECDTNENLRKDGKVILCEWYNTPLVDESGTCTGVASLVMNITERTQNQRLLAWEKAAFELIVGSDTLEDSLDRLMRGLEELSPGMLCSVMLTDKDGDHMRHGGAPSLPDDYNRAIDGVAIDPEIGADSLRKRVILADIGKEAESADHRKLARRFGLRSCWSTPIHGNNGRALGIFEIYHTAPHKPLDSQLDLMARAEHIIRIAIERKQAQEELQKFNTILEERVRDRTLELQAANSDLEAFTYSVSHDLRAPLRAVGGFSRMVLEDYSGQLDQEGLRMLGVIHSEADRMGRLIDELLAFSRIGRQPIESGAINMEALAKEAFDELAAGRPERKLHLKIQPLPAAHGAEAMIRQVWMNLISNAIKFTKGREIGEIEIGSQVDKNGEPVYYIKDNGAGFDMRHADKLFGVFQRLHSQQEFPGTGVGLALVQRIIQRHGGEIWAESEVGKFAAFYFTIPYKS